MDRSSRSGITPEQTRRLQAALSRWLVGESELRAVVLDAVDAGATVSQVAEITGLREETIEQWTGLEGDRSTPQTRSGTRTANAHQVINSDGEVDQLAERRSLRGGGWPAVDAAEAKSRRRNPDSSEEDT